MRSIKSKAFDAAVSAIQGRFEREALGWCSAEPENLAGDALEAADEVRWPEKPAPEVIEAMIEAYADGRRDPNATVRDIFAKVYSGLRTSMLGEDA